MYNRGNIKIVLIAIIIVILATLFLIPLAKNRDVNVGEKKFTTISIDKVELRAEVADTKEKRSLGLSGRESLDENEALLFLFDKEGTHGFWMKNMKFPIDILWLNQNNKIVGITKEAQPDSYPGVFYPEYPAITVIEVNAGWVDKNNINFESVVVFSTE